MKTYWFCEDCEKSGSVKHAPDCDVWHVVVEITAAHKIVSPQCDQPCAKIRVSLHPFPVSEEGPSKIEGGILHYQPPALHLDLSKYKPSDTALMITWPGGGQSSLYVRELFSVFEYLWGKRKRSYWWKKRKQQWWEREK